MRACRSLHAGVLEANGPNVGAEAPKQMHKAGPSKHRAGRNAKIGVDDARQTPSACKSSDRAVRGSIKFESIAALIAVLPKEANQQRRIVGCCIGAKAESTGPSLQLQLF